MSSMSSLNWTMSGPPPNARRTGQDMPAGAYHMQPQAQQTPATAPPAATRASLPLSLARGASPFAGTALRPVRATPSPVAPPTSNVTSGSASPFSSTPLRPVKGVPPSGSPSPVAPSSRSTSGAASPSASPFLTTPLKRAAQRERSSLASPPPSTPPVPFSPALLSSAAARAHPAPLPVDEHIVAAPESTAFERASARADGRDSTPRAERYFHARRISALEARRLAEAGAAAVRKMAQAKQANGAGRLSQGHSRSSTQSIDEEAALDSLRVEAQQAQLEEWRVASLAAAAEEDEHEEGSTGVAVTVGGSDTSGVIGTLTGEGSYGSGDGASGTDASPSSSSGSIVTFHVVVPTASSTTAPLLGSGSVVAAPSTIEEAHQLSMDDGPPHWAYSAAWTAETLRSDVTQGLSLAETAGRLRQIGPNTMPRAQVSFLQMLRSQLREPLILLLVVIATLYALWGHWEESTTALVVVGCALALELGEEFQAKRAVQRVYQSTFHPMVTVWRRGVGATKVDRETLVPGDVLEFAQGDRLSVDGRVISSTCVSMDESTLTGDAHPQAKDASLILSPATPLHARANMLWSGSLVLSGNGRLMVTSTGARTRMGRQAQAELDAVRLQGTKERHARTPTQQRMKQLSLRLTVAAALCCMLAMSLGFMRGYPYKSVLLAGLALAFASIPAKLPLLVKSVLSFGVLPLQRRGVLIKSLRTAENLAGVSLLLTDKSGVLTRNKLSVLRMAMPGKVLRVPRSGGGRVRGLSDEDDAAAGDASPPRPFTASTEDMLAFEPLLEQGWMMSSPTLVDQLTLNAGGHVSTPDPNRSPLSPQTPLTAAATAADILSHAFPSASGNDASGSSSAILDPFDASFLRFFAATRSHPRDLNSVFLRKLFADSFRVAQQSTLLHVLPWDTARRRSSCIRRLHVSSSDIGPLRLCCRGGAESVLDCCVFALHATGRIITLDAAARAELKETLRELSESGLRVMGFAVRSLLQDDLDALEHLGAAAAATAPSRPASAQSRGDEGVEVREGAYPSVPPSPASSSPARLTPRGSGLTTVPLHASPSPLRSPSRSASLSSSSSGALTLHPSHYSSLERRMTFLGFVGFGDEVRQGVAASVAKLQRAGIQLKMFTGENARTGAAVARAVGILKPEQAAGEMEQQQPRGPYDQSPRQSLLARQAAAAARRQRRRARELGVSTDSLGSMSGSPDVPIPGVCVGRQTGPQPTAVTPLSLVSPYGSQQLQPSIPDPSAATAPDAASYDLSASVYCRMSPSDKLALVRLHQERGHSVLVTGAGLSDSGALVLAEAGLAMGSSGTDLARECAGMILTRDDFRAVVHAVAEGRRVLSNLASAVAFYLACKLALVFLFLTPVVLGYDLPLSPVHVVLLASLVSLCSYACFTSEPAPPNVLSRSPAQWSPARYMRGRKYATTVFLGGALLFASVGGVLLAAHSVVIEGSRGDAVGDESSIVPTSSSHSSSSFFPSVLAPYRPNAHLPMIQGLVLVSWLLSSVLLAQWMRSPRSMLFACCDRTSIRYMRNRRRKRSQSASSLDDDVEGAGGSVAASPHSSLSAALRSGRHTGYQSLSQTDPEPGLGAHAAFLHASPTGPASSAGGSWRPRRSSALLDESGGGRGGGSDNDSDASSQGSGVAQGSPGAPELEGLHRPRPRGGSRAGAFSNEDRSTEDDSAASAPSVLTSVFPLFCNLPLLLWAVATLLLAVGVVACPWIWERLQLDDLTSQVGMPRLFGDRSPTFPAYALAVLLPAALFLLAEVGKFIVSLRAERKFSARS